ncbi:MAG: NADH-quinone oxidoreductase subunit N [Acidobacteria bacterium]|nr:NADH-quinone oxidoreductase subunit N [Acidobacteriota bacterium]
MDQFNSASEVFSFLRRNAAYIGPQIHLVLWGMGLLILDFLIPKGKKHWMSAFSLLGIGAALVHWYRLYHGGVGRAFYDMISLDSFSLFFQLIVLIAAALTILMSYRYLDVEGQQHGEYYALILFATSGMTFMVAALDLVTIFVGLELMSVSVYVLVGLLRSDPRSNEAALKYFLLGAFSTGVLLYGMSLLYGISGSTNLQVIGQAVGQNAGNPVVALGLVAMLAGLFFKVAAVPFHMWAPDAYEGAPTSVTAFMSVAVKAAAFAIFYRILMVAFGSLQDLSSMIIALVAIATMTLGNWAAVTQSNIKRLLAYSSVSHAGYVLLGLAAGTELGVRAGAVYLFIYTFMNLGAWAVVLLLRRRNIAGEQIDDFNGMFFRNPWVAVLMLLFLLSLGGIPPLAGFIAKYYVFSAVIDVYLASGSKLMLWLAIIAVLNAAVALYFYLRFVLAMFVRDLTEPAELCFSAGIAVTLAITAAATILIGIYPDPVLRFAEVAAYPLL